MRITNGVVARSLAAALLAFSALNALFATAGTVAYRLGALGVAERLGRFTPGDDYRRLIPLMEAVPTWLHALWVLAGALYLVAIALAIWRIPMAYAPVLVAVGLELAANILGSPIIAATGVMVHPNPSSWIVLAGITLAMQLLAAGLLWYADKEISDAIVAST